MRNIMLDLETWGTGPNALPISIGAVCFNGVEDVTATSDAFETGILPTSADPFKFDITAATMEWWLHPDRDEARVAWLGLGKVDIATALQGFTLWARGPGPDHQPYRIWGNASTFDNVILRNAFDKVIGVCPWSFRNDMCYRTLKTLVPDVKGPTENFGVAHTALADALWQARHLQMIAENLAIEL